MINLDIISSSTGAPQGTVLAPFLFSIYTADYRSSSESCLLAKFADDTAMVGLITGDDDTEYRQEVETFTKYCRDNHLVLNVSKTKEMIIDFRTNTVDPVPITIDDGVVERISEYKYLGVVIDHKFSWKKHFDLVIGKLNSRFYCLRKLNQFQVDNALLGLFYQSVFVSIFSYCLVCFGGAADLGDKDRIDRIIRKVEKIIGEGQQRVDSVYQSSLKKKLRQVMGDETHPLHERLMGRVIERSGRLRTYAAGTNRFNNSFIPMAIAQYNSSFRR